MNSRRIDPRGDMNSRHRGYDRIQYHYETTPISLDIIKPFDILLVRKKSLISALIIHFSRSDGIDAWLSHAGQILPWDSHMRIPEPESGLIVSEANYPYHEYIPIDKYLSEYERGKCRLTLVRIRPDLFPSLDIRSQAQRSCLEYHLSIAGERYDVVGGLLPMLLISLVRNSIPWLKRGKWFQIPKYEDQEKAFICSRIVDLGWAPLQQLINTDIFPSSLSCLVPSPQDIFDSQATVFVAGTRKVYTL